MSESVLTDVKSACEPPKHLPLCQEAVHKLPGARHRTEPNERPLLMRKNTQIAEQNTQIAEQWATICNSVRMLYQAGMTIDSIALNLNLGVEKVQKNISET